jgi:diguanylate cyclase (GGDEF)-like protein
VIFVDVDHLKPVNDTFGHQAGDMVLKMVAQTLLKNCRSFDLVGRWGERIVCYK